ncbi:MAG: hypothetical protein QNI87_04720 [Erythrobacter sp.]|uniref:hypothetical protein n=1 Tax=Erythrobacter sp. TaxID=1042 RepID=UPI0026224E96|nr:hypothetical protein [Erythrobacter sp.]MDJ0977818.1 hypothetical protein [Erythrobacter sp.]
MIALLLSLYAAQADVPDAAPQADIATCREAGTEQRLVDAYSIQRHLADHSVELVRAILRGDNEVIRSNVASNVALLTLDEANRPMPRVVGVDKLKDAIQDARPVSYQFAATPLDRDARDLCARNDVLITVLRADGQDGYDVYMSYLRGFLFEVEMVPIESRSGKLGVRSNG